MEVGPIRPPSEARSLLIRVTKNCPWNRCEFCSVFKGERFQLRTVPEVKEDILAFKRLADDIRKWAETSGHRVGDVARINGILWLEGLLQSAPFAFVLISHDRYFLDTATNRILELNPQYPGGYLRVEGSLRDFLVRKEELLASQAKLEEVLANKLRQASITTELTDILGSI